MKLLLRCCLLAVAACDVSVPAELLTPANEPLLNPIPEPPPAEPASPEAGPQKPLPIVGDPLGLLSKPPPATRRHERVDPRKLDPGALMASAAPKGGPIDRDPRAVARVREAERKPFREVSSVVRDVSPSALVREVEDAPGKARVLLLHASYCGPCRKAMPKFIETVRAYQPRGVHFSAASVDRNREAFLAYVPALGSAVEPLWIVRDSAVAPSLRRLGLKLEGESFGIPLLAVFDRRRKLVMSGSSREIRKLASALDALLE